MRGAVVHRIPGVRSSVRMAGVLPFRAAIAAVVCVCFMNFSLSTVRASSVSYLSQGPSASAVYAQQIPIQALQIEQNLEMVPYYGVPISGDVLQAQGGRSPTSDMCNGSDMSSNSFVCSEFSSGDDVEDSVSGITFRKSCEINVIYATYPAFFHGGDFVPQEGDGRIDFWRGEWPSFSDVSGRTTPDADYVAGVGLVPGDEYH
ncbi:MAG: hypothetical protein PHG63_03295, partial [Candidatus Dojkabacteria bacterium]|nr:hypothetical protein [Candidatus Dojkabacteria bacterium]